MNYGDNNGARGERDRNKPRVVAGLRDVHKSGERIHGHWATAIDHFARNKKTRFPISTRISEIATPFLRIPSPFFIIFSSFFTYPDAFHWPPWDGYDPNGQSIALSPCNGNGTDPWPILTLSRSEFQEKHRKQEGGGGEGSRRIDFLIGRLGELLQSLEREKRRM